MFIKNKIMVSLKKYIIKWLKILQTPIVKEFPFFLLFLLAIRECKLNCVNLQ